MSSYSYLRRKLAKKTLFDMYRNSLPQVGNLGPGDVWHVNSDISGGDGTSWDTAFDTMTEAIDACADGDTILLSGTIIEHIDYSSYAAGPNRIRILGAGEGICDANWFQVTGGTSYSDMIDLQCYGWTFDNIRFRGPKEFDIFKLDMPTSAGGAYGTTIKNCWLRRPNVNSGASIGIDMIAVWDCHIINNDIMIAGTTGYGITVDHQGFSFPNGNTIAYNRFQECSNQIELPLINSFVLYNIFQGTGHVTTTTKHLDLTGGNDNVVFGNSFGGNYTTDNGSYVAGGSDNWAGNYSTDTAEAEVADNGITIAVPAAGAAD